MQLTPCQGGLQHIASVHCALALACAHHGVQLVDEDNRLAFVFGQIFQHRFQALFKFTTEFGTRQQCSHVQTQHAFAQQSVWHFARHNALRQAFHNRGFTHARLTNQHRVVFGAALQHLNGAANFIVTANHGV